MKRAERIGILGGTFDPIHYGHLVLAEEVKEALGLDRVLFVPAFIPPHKSGGHVLNERHRTRMVSRAIRGNPSFELSRIELEARSISYTVETLKTLHRAHPKAKLFFIAGSDNVRELRAWRQIREIFRLCTFVVAKRPRFPLDGVPRSCRVVEIVLLDIASSDIRERVARGRSIRYLVPEGVRRYIEDHRLYRKGTGFR